MVCLHMVEEHRLFFLVLVPLRKLARDSSKIRLRPVGSAYRVGLKKLFGTLSSETDKATATKAVSQFRTYALKPTIQHAILASM